MYYTYEYFITILIRILSILQMEKILENGELLNFNISRKKFILRCNITIINIVIIVLNLKILKYVLYITITNFDSQSDVNMIKEEYEKF